MAKGRLKKRTSPVPSVTSEASASDEDVTGGTLQFAPAAGLYLVILSIYCYTTFPSVAGGDTGELLSAACEGGVAHPPGYPLWTLLSIAAIYALPFSPAYSVNLLTCATGALSTVILYFVCHRLCSSVTGSIISALVFSLSSLTWTWATTAEVFALNNLLTTLLLYVLIKFEFAVNSADRQKAACVGAFVLGLALSNQHTIVLFVPAIVCRVVYKLFKLKEVSVPLTLSSLAMGCIGLSPYCYLLISSYRNTARWSWGDQTTLNGFQIHLLREEYGSFRLGSEDGATHGFVQNLVEYKRTLLHELTFPGYVLACIGLVQTFIDSNERVRRVVQTCLVMMIFYVAVFCWRANLDVSSSLMREVVERFWIQPNIVWSILLAMGWKLLYIRLNAKVVMPFLLNTACVVLVFAVCLGRGWHHANHHSDTTVPGFAESMISSFPNNSLVLTKGDLPSGTMRYLQFCEGRRQDITLVEQELMSYNWYIPKMRHLMPSVKFPGDRWHNVVGRTSGGIVRFNMLNFLDANIAKRPIFVCIGMQDKESSWSPKYQLFPYGACHQVVRDERDWVENTHPYQDTWTRDYSNLRNGSWEAVANEEMWNAKISKALFFYKAASETADNDQSVQLYKESYKIYNRVIETHSVVPEYYHKNYALACEKMARSPALSGVERRGYLLDAIEHFEKYILTNSGQDDPQYPAILPIIESLRSQVT